MSQQEYDEYKMKEKERDAIIERNKKVKKKGIEEPMPSLEAIQYLDHKNWYQMKNSRLKLMINLEMQLKDSYYEQIYLQIRRYCRIQKISLERNQYYDYIYFNSMKSTKARQVTNTSQIETTLNNQSISSRKVPKLPYLYTKHNQVLSTSRKLLLEENSVLIQLTGQKKELLKMIYDRQLDDAIDITRKLVQQCIAYDLNIFGKSLHILADLYISNREFANGLYIYNVLRVLADVQNNQALKIEALIQMGDLCKLQQQYQLSKIFLKKALQYVWYMNDTENEATIYDYFGVLYYVQGELRLAKEYHDRAMNFIKESSDSAARKHGIEYVKTYIKRINYQSQVMNNMVLSKLGLIQGNETEIKLNTLLDFNILTDQILQDYEFQVEMSTPNRPQRCITKNGVLQNDVDMFENVKELHERQKKRKFFEKKIPIMHLTRSVFKQTIEEQLEQRMKTDKQKNSVEEYKKQLQKFHTYKNFPEKLEKVNINHLSPNRNLIGFKYSFKPMRHSLLDLFGEIEQYMYLHQS